MNATIPPNLMQLTFRPEVVMARGQGSFLWDEQGNRYLDFVQGWAVNCLGHNPPELLEAFTAQLRRAHNVGPAYHSRPGLTLAQKLAEHSGLDRVFFSCSGAEANETAVKLARKWGQLNKAGAYEVITTLDGFHGRTLAMTCATGKPGWDTAFPPAVPGFRKVPFGDVAALAQAISETTVAVMLEPFQGEAGVVVPPEDYLRQVRALCDQHEVLLIADEIQTGMARTGPLFAYQASGIRPDVMTLGKGLGGGLPLSATLCSERVACFNKGDHGGTFAAHSSLCTLGLAVLDTLTRPAQTGSREDAARHLESALQQLAAKHGLTVRGRGFLWALVMDEPRAEQVRNVAFELGLLVNAARPNVLRLMPALNVSRSEVDEMATLLDRALAVPL